jgi:hypothetical protein
MISFARCLRVVQRAHSLPCLFSIYGSGGTLTFDYHPLHIRSSLISREWTALRQESHVRQGLGREGHAVSASGSCEWRQSLCATLIGRCSCWSPSKKRRGGQPEEYELGFMSREGRPTSEGFGKYSVDPDQTFFAGTASPSTLYQPIRPAPSAQSSLTAGRPRSSHLPTRQTHLAPLTATRSLPTTTGALSDLGAIGRPSRPRLQNMAPYSRPDLVHQVPLSGIDAERRFHLGPVPSQATDERFGSPTLPPSAPPIKRFGGHNTDRDSVTVPGLPPLDWK